MPMVDIGRAHVRSNLKRLTKCSLAFEAALAQLPLVSWVAVACRAHVRDQQVQLTDVCLGPAGVTTETQVLSNPFGAKLQ